MDSAQEADVNASSGTNWIADSVDSAVVADPNTDWHIPLWRSAPVGIISRNIRSLVWRTQVSVGPTSILPYAAESHATSGHGRWEAVHAWHGRSWDGHECTCNDCILRKTWLFLDSSQCCHESSHSQGRGHCIRSLDHRSSVRTFAHRSLLWPSLDLGSFHSSGFHSSGWVVG